VSLSRTSRQRCCPAGGVLGQLVKQYKKLSNWELGWGVLETRQIVGETLKSQANIKSKVIAIPVDGFLDYFDDCELVAQRLQHAGRELVRRWNEQQPKKVLDWTDEICREEWRGRGGKVETSIYETILSTYAFFVRNEDKPDAVIAESDLKVRASAVALLSLRVVDSLAPPLAGAHQAAHHPRLQQGRRRTRQGLAQDRRVP